MPLNEKINIYCAVPSDQSQGVTPEANGEGFEGLKCRATHPNRGAFIALGNNPVYMKAKMTGFYPGPDTLKELGLKSIENPEFKWSFFFYNANAAKSVKRKDIIEGMHPCVTNADFSRDAENRAKLVSQESKKCIFKLNGEKHLICWPYISYAGSRILRSYSKPTPGPEDSYHRSTVDAPGRATGIVGVGSMYFVYKSIENGDFMNNAPSKSINHSISKIHPIGSVTDLSNEKNAVRRGITTENVQSQLEALASFGVIGTLSAGFALSNIYEIEAIETYHDLAIISMSTIVVSFNFVAVAVLTTIFYAASRINATAPQAANTFLRELSFIRHTSYRVTLLTVPLFIASATLVGTSKATTSWSIGTIVGISAFSMVALLLSVRKILSVLSRLNRNFGGHIFI
jgi:hypothetical protein